MAAAVTASRLITALRLGRAMAAAVVSAGVVTLLIPLASPHTAIPLLVMALAGVNFGGVLYNIAQVSLRQAITPEHMLGRMNATVRFLVWGAIPVGAALGGALGDQFGLRFAIWTGSLIALAAVIPVTWAPLRRLRELNEH